MSRPPSAPWPASPTRCRCRRDSSPASTQWRKARVRAEEFSGRALHDGFTAGLKMTTTKEIREKETGHLSHELVEAQKRLFELRGQAVTEKLEDPSQLRKTRRAIARM